MQRCRADAGVCEIYLVCSGLLLVLSAAHLVLHVARHQMHAVLWLHWPCVIRSCLQLFSHLHLHEQSEMQKAKGATAEKKGGVSGNQDLSHHPRVGQPST